MKLLISLLRFFRETFYSLVLYRNIKVFGCNHMTISLLSLYRKKVVFPHPVGIVIGSKVQIGMNCTIYQNVTIGTKDTVDYKNAPYPRLGNNVTIFANSVVFGDIEIGDNVLIGAGSVVFTSIPANSKVAGNPAKILNGTK